jgi:hypothetical protein
MNKTEIPLYFYYRPSITYFLKAYALVPEKKHVIGLVERHDIPSEPPFYTMYKEHAKKQNIFSSSPDNL